MGRGNRRRKRRSKSCSNNSEKKNKTVESGCYGVVNIYEIDSTNPSYLIKTTSKDRISRDKIRNPKNFFIDNTNLHNNYTKNLVPIAAYSVDGGIKYRLGIIVFYGAKHIIILPCTYNDGNVADFTEPHITIDTMNTGLRIEYLNNVNSAPTIPGTNYIKCNTDGADKVYIKSIPNDVQQARKDEAKDPDNGLISINNSSSSSSYSPIAIPFVRKKRQSTSRIGKAVAYVRSLSSVNRGKESLDGLFTVRYLDKEVQEGMVALAYITYDSAKWLVEQGTHKREDWDPLIASLSKKDAELYLHEVTENGLALVEASGDNVIGTTSVDIARVEAYEREGITFANWSVEDNVTFKTSVFRKIIKKSFGNFGFGRPCSRVLGFNWYKATNPFAYVRSTPRKGDDITTSQLHREQFDPTLLPLVYKCINKATELALCNRNQTDPLYESLQQEVIRRLDSKYHAQNTNQANSINQLQILTSGNAITPGMSNGSHFDVNDSHPPIFNRMVLQVIAEWIKSLKTDSDAVNRERKVRAISHLLRLGVMDESDGKYNWSLPTACGYAPTYNGPSNRKVWVAFIYDSIDTAVLIPMNRVAYNTFNGVFSKHHTCIPITYDEDMVYMNDPNLFILAWGGSTAKKDFVMNNFGNEVANGDVNWTGPVNMETFAGILHQLGANAMNMATNENLITQTTLDNWLLNNPLV